jgi:hypothetical protein
VGLKKYQYPNEFPAAFMGKTVREGEKGHRGQIRAAVPYKL